MKVQPYYLPATLMQRWPKLSPDEQRAAVASSGRVFKLGEPFEAPNRAAAYMLVRSRHPALKPDRIGVVEV